LLTPCLPPLCFSSAYILFFRKHDSFFPPLPTMEVRDGRLLFASISQLLYLPLPPLPRPSFLLHFYLHPPAPKFPDLFIQEFSTFPPWVRFSSLQLVRPTCTPPFFFFVPLFLSSTSFCTPSTVPCEEKPLSLGARSEKIRPPDQLAGPHSSAHNPPPSLLKVRSHLTS